ncbi:MAG TPA: DUF664 domain-containing protein, partial [Micromonospora sp.]
DHDIYRLGEQFVVRLPRIGWATAQAAKEAEWLPRLAPHLPLAVPVPVAMGCPDQGYPFDWSVCEWLPGENANGTIGDRGRAAADLAAFVTALRRIDTTGAFPRLPGRRGCPLAELDDAVRRSVGQLGDRIDGAATLRLWQESLDAPEWDGPEVWLHGDLLPGNLLVVEGRLSAVIDFGGLNVGDPACDLQPAWHLFEGADRERFRAEVGSDEASWLRGRGWVICQTVTGLAYYWDTNPGMIRQSSHALAQVLAAGSPPMTHVRQPPVAGDETDTLLGALERSRATLAWKCGGLDEAGMRATVGASSMTLGGLLKHVALVEDEYFSHRLLGRELGPPWNTVDWDADPDWEWRSATEDSPEQLMALWRNAVARSRAAVAEVLVEGSPDQFARWTNDRGESPSLRRILVDLIEEYARHVGHADLIRESVDGLVGEDPPR